MIKPDCGWYDGSRSLRPIPRIAAILAVAFFACFPAFLPETSAQESESAQPWNLFSARQESVLGIELAEWVDARVDPLSDTLIESLSGKVTARLLQAKPSLWSPDIHPVRSSESYALGLPGGTLYLTSRLLEQVRCKQDLAGLLAHELAHMELRQLTRRLSAAHRFRLQAALVSEERGEATMVEALQAVDLDPLPGGPMFYYSVEEESEALKAAAERLGWAGYARTASALFLRGLADSSSAAATRYLERHPALQAAGTKEGGKHPASNCKSERAYRRMAGAAEKASLNAAMMDRVLAWSEPAVAPKVARTRERLINRSYAFDYPGTWTPANAGPNETIEVAPKGGWWHPAGQTPRLALGLTAGMLDPFGDDLVGNVTLHHHLDALRPGLVAVTAAAVPEPSAPVVYGQWLSGTSPSGVPERVWALYRRLPGQVFFMLLIAPADRFAEYQAEFQAIANSIDFPGQPVPGQPEVPSQGRNHP